MIRNLISFFAPPSPQTMAALLCKRAQDAARHVPYYRDLIRNNGVAASFQTAQECIDQFPRSTSIEYRRAIQQHGESYVRDERYLRTPVIRLRTGGSSGVPVEILRSQQEYAIAHGVKTVYELVRAGVRPWDRICAFLPPWDITESRHLLQRLGVFQRFDVSFSDSPEHIIQRLRECRVNVLFGRTSVMRALAHYGIKQGIRQVPVKVLLPGADVINSGTRDLLHEFFRPKHYGEIYGSTETGIIGLRRADSDYEVEFRTVFFCLSAPVTAGRLTQGSMVVTSLVSKVAPIVMLDLGDEIVCRNYDGLLDLRASITEVRGRVSESIFDDRGEQITASTIYSWLTPVECIQQYRVEQEPDGRVTVRVVLRNPTSDKTKIEALARGHFGGRVRYKLSLEEHIPFDDNGKTRVVVNKGRKPQA